MNRLFERLAPEWALALVIRWGAAAVFFLSGRTKVEGWLKLKGSTVHLFETEYRVPLLSPVVAAHLTAYLELFGGLLLVVGLFTRMTALAFLAITLVIEVFVYPMAWPTHLSWAGLLLYLIGRGAGGVSLDRLFKLD